MKVLIFINYQREIPPFMQVEMEYADKIFDKVYYVSQKVSNGNVIADKNLTNTSLIEVGKFNKFIHTFGLPFWILKKPFRATLTKLKRDKKLTVDSFKHVLSYILPYLRLKKKCKSILKKHYVGDEVYVVSSWFFCSAYISAAIAKKYPNVNCYSFAHAFEIDPERNEYLNYSFDDIKYEYLKEVFFISQKKFDAYLNSVDENLKEKVKEKTSVVYLGCKREKPIATERKGDAFVICSCSSIVSIKRLDIIVDALKEWNGKKIKWIHVGSGPIESEIKEKAELVTKNNANVEIVFTGHKANRDVHEFYSKNKIDLFINVSETEGLPVSIMEAMSYGIPVFATDVGGTSEIVNDENGKILPSDVDGSLLKRTIEDYLLLSDQDKIAVREKALATWENKFNADKNIVDFYRKKVIKE